MKRIFFSVQVNFMALPVKKNKLVHVLLKFCISKDKASCLNHNYLEVGLDGQL